MKDNSSIVVSNVWTRPIFSVADLGGVRGVQMHPPLVASNVFLLI